MCSKRAPAQSPASAGSRSNQSHWAIGVRHAFQRRRRRDCDRPAGELHPSLIRKSNLIFRTTPRSSARSDKSRSYAKSERTISTATFSIITSLPGSAREIHLRRRATHRTTLRGGRRVVLFTFRSQARGRVRFSFSPSRPGAAAPVLCSTRQPVSPWRGAFSALSAPIRDPLTGQPFPGNKSSANRLDVRTGTQTSGTLLPCAQREVLHSLRRSCRKTRSSRSRRPITGLYTGFNDKNAIYGRFTLQDVSLRAHREQSADCQAAFPASLQSRIRFFLYAQLYAYDDQRSALRFWVQQ